MNLMRMLGLGLAMLAFMSLAAGCGKNEKADKEADKAKAAGKKGGEHKKSDEGDHVHGPGPHGGTITDWGGGKYHVEFVVDHDKKEATVYVLGGDEETPAPIQAKDGQILLTIDEPKFQVTLKAAPLKGESEEKASRFVGQHEKLGIVREFSGIIIGVVDGTPFRGPFKEEAEKK